MSDTKCLAPGLPPAIFLMGPTASGKTDLALELVRHFPLEIISVDSALIYREMNIGTAKPTAFTLAEAPHRLIDILDPAECYSAARFREDALREMADIVAKGRIPLLVGGTMLYFRALESGLSELPAADPAIRMQIMDEARRSGWTALHEELRYYDPIAAARIHPNDPQRLQRALEVIRLTGKPMSDQQSGSTFSLPYRLLRLGLMPQDRQGLHERIRKRFVNMLAQGLINEVADLYQRGDLSPCLPSIRSVGYRQVWRYLAGEWDQGTMTEKAIAATRQLAKRQMTWMRGDKALINLNADEIYLSKLNEQVGQFIEGGS